jgi:hypothetical protein
LQSLIKALTIFGAEDDCSAHLAADGVLARGLQDDGFAHREHCLGKVTHRQVFVFCRLAREIAVRGLRRVRTLALIGMRSPPFRKFALLLDQPLSQQFIRALIWLPSVLGKHRSLGEARHDLRADVARLTLTFIHCGKCPLSTNARPRSRSPLRFTSSPLGATSTPYAAAVGVLIA